MTETVSGHLTNPDDNARFCTHLAALWRRGVFTGVMVRDDRLGPHQFRIQGNRVYVGTFAYERFLLMRKRKEDGGSGLEL
jgi:hypothetical protein